MDVSEWPLERIKPYPGNPRKRSPAAVEKVAASIKEFGWRQPIVVDESGVILVGHGRREAAEFLGLPTAPVHQALGLTEAQKTAYRIADNRVNEESIWDEKLLAIELKGLDGFNLSLTGLDSWEFPFDPATASDPTAEYFAAGMPEFGQDDLEPWKSLVVHFVNQADYDRFARLVQQTLNEKTKSIWYPAQERANNNTQYVDGSPIPDLHRIERPV